MGAAGNRQLAAQQQPAANSRRKASYRHMQHRLSRIGKTCLDDLIIPPHTLQPNAAWRKAVRIAGIVDLLNGGRAGLLIGIRTRPGAQDKLLQRIAGAVGIIQRQRNGQRALLGTEDQIIPVSIQPIPICLSAGLRRSARP